ncbi:hypothetical protein AAEO56_06760 [Flavobacterium sp. DGU11]|uniref:Uncharacterized protein n=1 Tax=Flavobacterium arundinis TaxID=3139143 RepID=A0ABU9HV29_9FLAO
MKFFTLLTALFIGLNAFAQDQQGYYIDNGGKKTEGYYKTTDFYNENSLEFTNSPGGRIQSLILRKSTSMGFQVNLNSGNMK